MLHFLEPEARRFSVDAHHWKSAAGTGPGAGFVPLQVCRAEEIHSRWLPLRDERERKQEPGKGPAARSRLVSMKEAVVVKGLGA